MKKLVAHILIQVLLMNSVWAADPVTVLKSDEIKRQIQEQEAIVGSLFDAMKKNQERLNLDLSQAPQESADDFASSLILHDIARQVSLCKSNKGKAKRGDVVVDPESKEKIDCSQFAVLEMKLLQLKNQEFFAQNQVMAFQCATRGFGNNAERLAMANQLQSLGLLTRDLKDYLPQLCPTKNDPKTGCIENIKCGFAKLMPDILLSDENEKYRDSCSFNIEANIWQCLKDAASGFINGLLSDGKALKELGALALDKTSELATRFWNWATRSNTVEADTDLSMKQILDAEINNPCPSNAQADANCKKEMSFLEKFQVGIENFFSEIGRSINQSLGANYACLDKNSEGDNCKEPVLGFDCATCSQKIRMMCGVGGFIGKEVLISAVGGLLFGVLAKTARGGAALAKGTAKLTHLDDAGRWAGRGVTNLGKAFMETPVGLTLSKYTAAGVGKVSSLSLQGKNLILNLGNKAFNFSSGKMDDLLKILNGNPKALAAWNLTSKGVGIAGKVTTYVPGKLLKISDDLFGYGYAFGSRGMTGVRAVRGAKLRMLGDNAVELINTGKFGDNFSPAFKAKIDDYNNLLTASKKIDEELAQMGAKVKAGKATEQDFINLSTRAEQVHAKLAGQLEDIAKQAKGEIKAAERALASQQKLEAQEARRQLSLDFNAKNPGTDAPASTTARKPDPAPAAREPAPAPVARDPAPSTSSSSGSVSRVDETPPVSGSNPTVDTPPVRGNTDLPDGTIAVNNAVEPSAGQMALDFGSDVKLLPAPSRVVDDVPVSSGSLVDDVPLSTGSVIDDVPGPTGATRSVVDDAGSTRVSARTERPIEVTRGRTGPAVASNTRSVGAIDDVIEFQRPGELVRTQGTIVSRTDDAVKVRTPSGNVVEIRANELDRVNVRNLYDTSNIPALAGKQSGDAIEVATKSGRSYSGVVEQVNNKSVRMRLDDGQVVTLRTRDLELAGEQRLRSLPVVREEARATIDNVSRVDLPDGQERLAGRTTSADDVAVKPPAAEPVQLELDLGLPDRSFVAAYGQSQVARYDSMAVVADRTLDVTDASGKVHKGMKLERVYHEENRMVHIYKGPNGELLEIDLAKRGLIVDMQELNTKGAISYIDPTSATARKALKEERVRRLAVTGTADNVAQQGSRTIDDIPVVVAKNETLVELKDLPTSKNLTYRLRDGSEFRGRFLRTEGDEILFVTTKGEIIRVPKRRLLGLWIGTLPVRIAINGNPIDDPETRANGAPPSPTATPTPAPTPSGTPTPAPTGTTSPSPTPTPTATATPDPKLTIKALDYDPTKGGRAVRAPTPLIIPPDTGFMKSGAW